MGMLAGATAGAGCYLTLVLPLDAFVAYSKITPHLSLLASSNPLPPGTLIRYVAAFDSINFAPELTLAIFAVVWGVAGAIAGRTRSPAPPTPKTTLLDLVLSGTNPRRWFAGDESAAVVGLRVGVTVGVVALVTTFGWFYAGFAQDLPRFDAVVRAGRTGMITGPLSDAFSLLSPVLLLALLLFGPSIVALIKNPVNRYQARTTAILLAAVIITSFLAAVGLRFIYFNIGLAPFVLSQAIVDGTETAVQLAWQLEQVLQTYSSPGILVMTTIFVAWATVIITVAAGLLLGGLQALISVGLVPLIVKRPVDRAAHLLGQIKQEPQDTLPILFQLNADREDAFQILAHVCILSFKSVPDLSCLAAAYHTLDEETSHAEDIRAVDTVRKILGKHTQWRWSADFGSIYGTLHDVLKARKLEQIQVIKLSRPRQADTLPVRIVQAVEYLDRIIDELHKSKKVGDLQTQLIFLENSLSEIHEAQRFASHAMGFEMGNTVSLPLRAALLKTLDHWQGIVLAATKSIKGRADLASVLERSRWEHSANLPLVWLVQNRGPNVAQDVRLRLLSSEDYQLGEEEVEIEILAPGEARQISLAVMPREDVRRMRVKWEILYDDAVVDDRRLTFADVVEFEGPRQAFRKVFPIPYVTGTPLKTDDVFVGREDVFAFIRENLLGQHQNNVIILHGQRRTGKTSVLYRLGRIMADTHFNVLIDMQGKAARGEADFLFSIADDIVFALEDAGIEAPLPERINFEGAPEFHFRNRFLRRLGPLLGGKKLLLMFDEFEELQRRVDSGRLQSEIFQFLRNLMQHEEQLDFVFSGTHRLEDLSAGYWSVLFNIAAYKPITFLSSREVNRLISDPVASYNIEYDPLAEERIIRIAAGHPYFTQLILHEMMVYHNEVERSYMTVADVDLVLDRILERGEAHFKHIWSESSIPEQLLLRAATECLHDSPLIDLPELSSHLSLRGYNGANWPQAMMSLTNREILTRTNVRTPRYRFKIDLIRRWVEKSQPAL